MLLDSADSPGISHPVSCTYLAGAAAASGTVGFALLGTGEQVWCLFQVWQGGPLCSGVSIELAYVDFLAFSQLLSGQEDDYHEEGAHKTLWTSQLH